MSTDPDQNSYRKMGIDDFIVHCSDGGQAFRDLVAKAIAPEPTPASLDDFRAGMAKSRDEVIGLPGVFLDRSPTGAGKTFSTMKAVKQVDKQGGRTLTILPSHKQCQEFVAMCLTNGVIATAYPPLNGDTCPRFDEAEAAMRRGFSPSTVLCSSCPLSDACEYRRGAQEADASLHKVCTHHRAKFCMASLADGANHVEIHEDPIGLLCPHLEATRGFVEIANLARIAAGEKWGRVAGEKWARLDQIPNENWFELNQASRLFFSWMENFSHELDDQLRTAEVTRSIKVPEPIVTEPYVPKQLYGVVLGGEFQIDADAMRLVLPVAGGVVEDLAVRVDRRIGKERKEVVSRAIIATQRTKLPEDTTVWICDATAHPDEIEAAIGRPIANKTQAGNIELQHELVQVASVDVKRSTAPSTVAKHFLGVIAHYPDAQRIGVICDSRHVGIFEGTGKKGKLLSQEVRSRIAKVGYFRGSDSRGSNDWMDCDLIIVPGTPRVPTSAVASRLIATGNVAAAARDGKWKTDYWSGRDRSGKRHTIKSLAYCDWDWHRAHRAIVRDELRQCVGRARAILDHGCPAVVVSSEDLGLVLADWTHVPVTDGMMGALKSIESLTQKHLPEVCPPEAVAKAGVSLISSLEFTGLSCHQLAVSITPSAIALSTKKSISQVKSIFAELADAGLVRHIGNRGGWVLTDSGRAFLSPSPTPSAPEVR
jgi:hypothetical protein